MSKLQQKKREGTAADTGYPLPELRTEVSYLEYFMTHPETALGLVGAIGIVFYAITDHFTKKRLNRRRYFKRVQKR